MSTLSEWDKRWPLGALVPRGGRYRCLGNFLVSPFFLGTYFPFPIELPLTALNLPYQGTGWDWQSLIYDRGKIIIKNSDKLGYSGAPRGQHTYIPTCSGQG